MRIVCVLSVLFLSFLLVQADGPPDLEGLLDPSKDGLPEVKRNPVSREWEAVWAKDDNGQLEIAHATYRNGVWTGVFITGTPENETRPRLAFDSFGDTIITWESAKTLPEVYATIKGSISQSYLPRVRLSNPTRISHLPDVAVLDDVIFIVYEVIDPDGRMNILMHHSTDDPSDRPAGGSDPIDVGRILVQNDKTSATANTYPRLHVQQGKLWLTWIQSEVELGYQVWLGQELSSPATVRYGHSRDLEDALEEVREIVLGQEEDDDD